MSLLSIVQTAAERLSLRRPTVVVTSTDLQVRQLFAFANEEGESLSKRGNWQELTGEHSFITSGSEVQSNTPIPPDLRKFVPNSFFNRTQARALVGPITPRQYQALRAQPVYGRVYLSFRERQGAFMITPAPTAGDTIAYEYVSKFWAKSDASQPKASFTADTDTAYLDEELIIQGVRWRFKAANGLDYAEDMETYERSVEVALADNGGAGELSTGTIAYDPMTSRPNVPEGSFGL